MSVSDDVMRIQKKLSKMTEDDGTVSASLAHIYFFSSRQIPIWASPGAQVLNAVDYCGGTQIRHACFSCQILWQYDKAPQWKLWH